MSRHHNVPVSTMIQCYLMNKLLNEFFTISWKLKTRVLSFGLMFQKELSVMLMQILLVAGNMAIMIIGSLFSIEKYL